MKYATALLATLMIASVAFAGPWLEWTEVDTGTYSQFTFTIRTDDGLLDAYYVNLAFIGVDGAAVNQIQAMGTDVNSSGISIFLGPDQYNDTWCYVPFGDNGAPGFSYYADPGAVMNSFEEGADYYEIAVTTGSDSASTTYGDSVALANIVVPSGAEVEWVGLIDRVDPATSEFAHYDQAGVTPEPATMALLGLGGLGLLRRRR